LVASLRQRLEQEKGRLSQVQKDKSQTIDNLDRLFVGKIRIEQSQIIIQNVAQQTQESLSWYINDMVTAAIEAVFPEDGFQFFLEFVQRRGRTEADLFLADSKGNRIKPSDAEGGGLVNVVAFALRVALWSLTKASRAVLILDEPFHFLHSRDAHAKVAELLSTISERLGLQIIMVTGEDESAEIIEGADKVIRIKKVRGVSTIIN
jgi:DNA repair exonuclease SbcCD ATPase subunit